MSGSENTIPDAPLEAKVAGMARQIESFTARVEALERIQSSAVSMSDICRAVAANGNAVRRELLDGCDHAAKAQRETYESLQADGQKQLSRITGGLPVSEYQAELSAATNARLDSLTVALERRPVGLEAHPESLGADREPPGIDPVTPPARPAHPSP